MNNAQRVSFYADLGTAAVLEHRGGCRLRWKTLRFGRYWKSIK